MSRYHCEFKTCFCTNFVLHCNNLCFHCKHANIWHSPKEAPPKDGAFVSTRQPARTPKYERKNLTIEIFEPRIPLVILSDSDEIIYCTDIEVLPV